MGREGGKILHLRGAGNCTGSPTKPPEEGNLFSREYQRLKRTGGLLTLDFVEMQKSYDQLGMVHPDVEGTAMSLINRDLRECRGRAQLARSEAMGLYLGGMATNLQLEADVAASLLFEDLASITNEVIRAALNNDIERRFIQPYGVLACASLVGLWLVDSADRLLAVSGSENTFTSFEIEDKKRKEMEYCHGYFSKTPLPSFAASLDRSQNSLETIQENARRVIRMSAQSGDPETGHRDS